MRLYYTPNSPYARIARVAVIESGLADRVEFVEATTRQIGTRYFDVTPLGRVPLLIGGERMLSDTRDICACIDELSGEVRWLPDEDTAAQSLRHVAVGFLDGVAVWLRKKYRPEGERSDTVIDYEIERALHALKWLEAHFDPDAWNFTALTLAVTFDIARSRGIDAGWSEVAPRLSAWATTAANRPAMAATAPLTA